MRSNLHTVFCNCIYGVAAVILTLFQQNTAHAFILIGQEISITFSQLPTSSVNFADTLTLGTSTTTSGHITNYEIEGSAVGNGAAFTDASPVGSSPPEITPFIYVGPNDVIPSVIRPFIFIPRAISLIGPSRVLPSLEHKSANTLTLLTAALQVAQTTSSPSGSATTLAGTDSNAGVTLALAEGTTITNISATIHLTQQIGTFQLSQGTMTNSGNPLQILDISFDAIGSLLDGFGIDVEGLFTEDDYSISSEDIIGEVFVLNKTFDTPITIPGNVAEPITLELKNNLPVPEPSSLVALIGMSVVTWRLCNIRVIASCWSG